MALSIKVHNIYGLSRLPGLKAVTDTVVNNVDGMNVVLYR